MTQFHGSGLKSRHVVAINVQVRPADGNQSSDELVAAAETHAAIRVWEMPENAQAKANSYPVKRQSERSMRFNAKYEHYLNPEQIIRIDAEARRAERAEQAKRDRAFKKEWNAQATIVFIGSAPSKAKGKTALRAETKAKRDEARDMERMEAVARLGIPNARPFRPFASEKNRIGRA